MQVLVLANKADPEAGFVGDALVARGATLITVWREDTEQPLPRPADHDLVLSLGSDWSVYWPRVADAVARESEFLVEAINEAVPVLGICFGGQILTHALGGTVQPVPTGWEIGWHGIDSEVPDLIPEGPYLQWHVDGFTPPVGAKEWARSSSGSQAYAYGSGLAVQFHPEVTADVVQRWAQDSLTTLEAAGTDLDTLVSASRAHEPAAALRADRLVDAFLSGKLTP